MPVEKSIALEMVANFAAPLAREKHTLLDAPALILAAMVRRINAITTIALAPVESCPLIIAKKHALALAASSRANSVHYHSVTLAPVIGGKRATNHEAPPIPSSARSGTVPDSTSTNAHAARWR